MIEETVKSYLERVLRVPTYMEEPEKTPGSYIRIEKVGSSVNNHIYSATIAIQSYGSRIYEAAQLNEKVKEAMDGIFTESSIISCRLNSDYNFTDTETLRYRYQAIFDINHY